MSRKLANAAALYLEGIRDGNVREAVEAHTGDRYTPGTPSGLTRNTATPTPTKEMT